MNGRSPLGGGGLSFHSKGRQINVNYFKKKNTIKYMAWILLQSSLMGVKKKGIINFNPVLARKSESTSLGEGWHFNQVLKWVFKMKKDRISKLIFF